ncbi:hypothetical protein PF005_g9553 [Phytophthora fragariae]|uniref:Uncharacterized protein n=1 Tax=Phytophthora fragariae TaxID=53985 RepID=A0A6A3HZS6_9STRA|nr:hypothetical protein PF003_g18419 [Phytophthora fragariae]KAE8944608.1 hypothetical protein PF009_g5705 [Phytophthora fragariae]KAE8976149.1 hypothetical protein PF011_g24171 [Phytophthora fragariae]KAE9061064.1 hypothetical protein PF007_g30389 [Phytophthora fragariae]KAE9073882.1 hypothetical protein PF010_g24897 [Phytophthora fragariae]
MACPELILFGLYVHFVTEGTTSISPTQTNCCNHCTFHSVRIHCILVGSITFSMD